MRFESDVISDSGKTVNADEMKFVTFESDVISDSGKTPSTLETHTAAV